MLDKITSAILIIQTIYEWLFPRGRYKKTLNALCHSVDRVRKIADSNKLSGEEIKDHIAFAMRNDKRSSNFLDRCLIKIGLKKKDKK